MAVPDLVEAAKDADILIFVVPHQFIKGQCKALFGKIKSTAVGLSLIKVSSVSSNMLLLYFLLCDIRVLINILL